MPCFMIQGEQIGVWKRDPDRWGQFGLATEFRTREEAEKCIRYIRSTWGTPDKVRNLEVVERATWAELEAELGDADLYCNLP